MCFFKKKVSKTKKFTFSKKAKFPFPKGWTIPKDKDPMDAFWDFWD